ncbi:MAG: LamG domain-containing protein [Cephaloticoccus sp.]|nr:LamG domain-containing protein [Cephaloticoccus sp.]
MKPSLCLTLALSVSSSAFAAETVAQWLFDEPEGLYPSTPLESTAGLDAPLVLGLGGSIVPGKFGQALSTVPYPPVVIPSEGEETAALHAFPVPPGRTQAPMSWHNAQFAAFMTSGENHIRKEVSFVAPTRTDLNLGDFDWTVEFWAKSDGADAMGTVWELGTGPRGENNMFTRILLNPRRGDLVLSGRNSGTTTTFKVERGQPQSAPDAWHHYALVYEVAQKKMTCYIDGRVVSATQGGGIARLPEGDEDYLSIGRDGLWQQPFRGELDELRVSRGARYVAEFAPPGSFAPRAPAVALKAGLPLLFAPGESRDGIVALGSRKHVFIDNALLEPHADLTFRAHPPKRVDRVMEDIKGQFRKHLTVVDDGEGLIRLYNPGPDDYLMVHVSTDGVNFTEPDTGIHHKGRKNIVIAESAPMGRPIIDPNGPTEHRWKNVSGHEGRGVYLYTSPDGWNWQRQRQAVLSFRSGSQESLFYDEQRGVYVGYHRTGFPKSEGGGTRREFVITEVQDIYKPWLVPLLSAEQVYEIAKTRLLRTPQPWWLDNGPLTPGDFGVELPTVFAPDDRMDPPGSGVYVPKADKYPWAPDTYLAFPVMYFDYEEPLQPLTRRILYEDKSRKLGSGIVEPQIAVSRDGVHWRRLPAPAYIPVGEYEGRDLHQIYIAEGMVKRGDEIWQYFYGQEDYHSPAIRKPEGNGVYRTVQRLDGFVSADAPYEREITVRTRLLTFDGDKLMLNIDTGGLGYALVGFEDEAGNVIPGFGADECVYINGNFVHKTVEWLDAAGRAHVDLSELKGRTVRVVFRLRGASLYALQFVKS